MKQKGSNAIIERAQDPFSFAVLRTSVWAGEAGVAEDSAVRCEQRSYSSVIELATIVSLQGKKRSLELGLNVRVKLNNDRQRFRLVLQRKGPYIMCIVIENHKVKLITRNTRHWRRPNI